MIIQYTSVSTIAGLVLLANLNTDNINSERQQPEAISTYTLCYDIGFQTTEELYDTYSGGFEAISHTLTQRRLSRNELIECTKVTHHATRDRQSFANEHKA